MIGRRPRALREVAAPAAPCSAATSSPVRAAGRCSSTATPSGLRRAGARLLARPADGRVSSSADPRGPGRGARRSSATCCCRRSGRAAAGRARCLRSGHRRAAAVAAMRREAAEISRLGSGGRLRCRRAQTSSRARRHPERDARRLERSAERERGFVASASHELRTPLALLRAELELALREGAPPRSCAGAGLGSERERPARQLAEDLLVLARADEGPAGAPRAAARRRPAGAGRPWSRCAPARRGASCA